MRNFNPTNWACFSKSPGYSTYRVRIRVLLPPQLFLCILIHTKLQDPIPFSSLSINPFHSYIDKVIQNAFFHRPNIRAISFRSYTPSSYVHSSLFACILHILYLFTNSPKIVLGLCMLVQTLANLQDNKIRDSITPTQGSQVYLSLLYSMSIHCYLIKIYTFKPES